jgi:hypothetical protein
MSEKPGSFTLRTRKLFPCTGGSPKNISDPSGLAGLVSPVENSQRRMLRFPMGDSGSPAIKPAEARQPDARIREMVIFLMEGVATLIRISLGTGSTCEKINFVTIQP